MGSKAILGSPRTPSIWAPCQLGTLQLISWMPRTCLEVLKRPPEMELGGSWNRQGRGSILLALLTCKGWLDPLDLWTEKKAVRSRPRDPFGERSRDPWRWATR